MVWLIRWYYQTRIDRIINKANYLKRKHSEYDLGIGDGLLDALQMLGLFDKRPTDFD